MGPLKNTWRITDHSAQVAGEEIVLDGNPKFFFKQIADLAFERLAIFLEQIAQAVRTADSFFQTDSLSCSNREQFCFAWIARATQTADNFF